MKKGSQLNWKSLNKSLSTNTESKEADDHASGSRIPQASSFSFASRQANSPAHLAPMSGQSQSASSVATPLTVDTDNLKSNTYAYNLSYRIRRDFNNKKYYQNFMSKLGAAPSLIGRGSKADAWDEYLGHLSKALSYSNSSNLIKLDTNLSQIQDDFSIKSLSMPHHYFSATQIKNYLQNQGFNELVSMVDGMEGLQLGDTLVIAPFPSSKSVNQYLRVIKHKLEKSALEAKNRPSKADQAASHHRYVKVSRPVITSNKKGIPIVILPTKHKNNAK